MNTRESGKEFENIATEYLKNSGYTIIDRNYSCKIGEIDIIARDGSYLVFVEVKYRKSSGKGEPELAVDYRKQRKISRTADYYFMKNNISADTAVRFDVVSILGSDISLYKNAFQYIGSVSYTHLRAHET